MTRGDASKDPRRPRAFAELADAEPGAVLDEAARARIRARIRREGPGVLRRARRKRLVVRNAIGVAGTMGVAAAIALAVESRRPSRACELTSAGDPAPEFALAEDGRWVLELDHARVVGTPETAARATVEACRTVITLEAGSLIVHARDLGGGELLVESAAGSVIVHGTVFSVEHAGSALRVQVAEGNVEVQRGGTAVARLRKGQRYDSRLNSVRPVERPSVDAFLEVTRTDRPARALDLLGLDPRPRAAAEGPRPAPEAAIEVPAPARIERRSEVRPAAPRKPQAVLRPTSAPDAQPIGPSGIAPPIAPARAETADDLFARGDELRRAGDLPAARAAYRRAGEMSGATAEGAWIALARLELAASNARAAELALHERTRRFPAGQLAIEASWLLVRALDEGGRRAAARDEANRLIASWPHAPQAGAARRWLETKGVR